MQQSGSLQRAVFLDRDGVINQALIRDGRPYSPRTIQDVVVIDGVNDAISLLQKCGFVTVVVSNQPDVARGHLTIDMLSEMQSLLVEKTGLQYFYTCIHDDGDGCICRKPNIGLIQAAARDLGLDISRSFMVGDRWKDIEAGQRAGCYCFFIDHEYCEKQPSPPFHTVASLLQAAFIITEGLDAN